MLYSWRSCLAHPTFSIVFRCKKFRMVSIQHVYSRFLQFESLGEYSSFFLFSMPFCCCVLVCVMVSVTHSVRIGVKVENNERERGVCFHDNNSKKTGIVSLQHYSLELVTKR